MKNNDHPHPFHVVEAQEATPGEPSSAAAASSSAANVPYHRLIQGEYMPYHDYLQQPISVAVLRSARRSASDYPSGLMPYPSEAHDQEPQSSLRPNQAEESNPVTIAVATAVATSPRPSDLSPLDVNMSGSTTAKPDNQSSLVGLCPCCSRVHAAYIPVEPSMPPNLKDRHNVSCQTHGFQKTLRAPDTLGQVQRSLGPQPTCKVSSPIGPLSNCNIPRHRRVDWRQGPNHVINETDHGHNRDSSLSLKLDSPHVRSGRTTVELGAKLEAHSTDRPRMHPECERAVHEKNVIFPCDGHMLTPFQPSSVPYRFPISGTSHTRESSAIADIEAAHSESQIVEKRNSQTAKLSPRTETMKSCGIHARGSPQIKSSGHIEKQFTIHPQTHRSSNDQLQAREPVEEVKTSYDVIRRNSVPANSLTRFSTSRRLRSSPGDLNTNPVSPVCQVSLGDHNLLSSLRENEQFDRERHYHRNRVSKMMQRDCRHERVANRASSSSGYTSTRYDLIMKSGNPSHIHAHSGTDRVKEGLYLDRNEVHVRTRPLNPALVESSDALSLPKIPRKSRVGDCVSGKDFRDVHEKTANLIDGQPTSGSGVLMPAEGVDVDVVRDSRTLARHFDDSNEPVPENIELLAQRPSRQRTTTSDDYKCQGQSQNVSEKRSRADIEPKTGGKKSKIESSFMSPRGATIASRNAINGLPYFEREISPVDSPKALINTVCPRAKLVSIDLDGSLGPSCNDKITEEACQKQERDFHPRLDVPYDDARVKMRLSRFLVLAPELRTVNLGFCGLESEHLASLIPLLIAAKDISQLHLENNKLVDLPDTFCSIVDDLSLQTLILQSNLMVEFPAVLLRCTSLVYLNLSRNKLTSVPIGITRLEHLECLELSHNQLTNLPGPGFGGMTKLQVLKLNHNLLTTIPDDIGLNNSALTVLDVSHNEMFIDGLPVTVANLREQMEDLIMNDTGILGKLPRRYSKATAMELIDLLAGSTMDEIMAKINAERNQSAARKPQTRQLVASDATNEFNGTAKDGKCNEP